MQRLRKPSRIGASRRRFFTGRTVIPHQMEPARGQREKWPRAIDIGGSVLVSDCKKIGATPPTATLPTMTCVGLVPGGGGGGLGTVLAAVHGVNDYQVLGHSPRVGARMVARNGNHWLPHVIFSLPTQ